MAEPQKKVNLKERRAGNQQVIQQNNEKKAGWNVSEEYKVGDMLGKGAYSVVVSATHIPTGKKVAIKRIVDLLGKKHEALRILREVVLLRMLDHPNIIKLYEISVPDTVLFNEIYLVEQYYPRDIKKLLRSNLFLTMQ